MRVRLKKNTSAYWNYAIQSFEVDQEVDGELARHLADNTSSGTVEVLEDDREEVRAAAETEPAPPEEPPPGPQTDPGTGDGPPVDGTIDDLMHWVDGDPDRAREALGAEQAKDKPRSTVVRRLAALADQTE